MKMTKSAGLVVGLAALTLSGVALATTSFTAYLPIRNLDATAEGMRVYQPGNVSQNPRNCTNTAYYEPAAHLGPAEREAFDKLLIAAFLAGRDVKLGIDSLVCGANNAPVYTTVRVDVNE